MKTRILVLTALILVTISSAAQASGALDDVWWLWMVRKLIEWASGWYGY